MPIKLMILSDSPAGPTGLGRITRELALRIHQNLGDVFGVCTYGCGAKPSSVLPFKQYEMKLTNMIPSNLPEVWKDFAGDEKGILLTIFNLTWLPWLANPDVCTNEELKAFLKTKPFKRWGYFPIDGHTIDGRMSRKLGEALSRFDRVLAYTKYGADVIKRSMDAIDDIGPVKPIEYLPHGLDTSVFYPRDRKQARENFAQMVAGVDAPLKPDVTMIGVVATNSPRKDWFLAFETVAVLKRRGMDVGMWVHTDHLRKSWDIEMLAEEFGLEGKVIASNRGLNDEELAWAYSAMDCTLSIGSGEGWGYAGPESLACGIPVVHGRYAGGAEIVPAKGLVDPIGFRGDGFFGILRPIYSATDWADKVQLFCPGPVRSSLMAPYIDWNKAWPRWAEWLKAGIA